VTLVGPFDRSLPRPGGSTRGRSSRPSSTISASGCGASSSSGSSVGIFTFVGLIVLSQLVDPIFGRYAVLLSIIAGCLELVPIIGPIISAVPAVCWRRPPASRCGLAALLLYLLVQQIENNFSCRRSRATRSSSTRRPSSSRSSSAGRWPGLLGAILALPVTAAFRDVVRYLFRRLTPEEPEALAPRSSRSGWDPPMPDAIDPYKVLQVDSEAEDEVIQAAYRRLRPQVPSGSRGDARGRRPDVAINAAWELIGDPAARAAFDRSRAAKPDTPPRRRSSPGIRGRRAAPARISRGRRRPGPAAATQPGPHPVARPRSPRSCRRTGLRALEPGRRLRRVDAHGPGPRRPPAQPPGRPVRDCAQLRALRGLVARARWLATTSNTSRWLDRAPIGRNYRQEIDEDSCARRAGASRRRARRQTGTGCNRRALAPPGRCPFKTCGPLPPGPSSIPGPTSGRIARSISWPDGRAWTSRVKRNQRQR
jgi:hypothetical protein